MPLQLGATSRQASRLLLLAFALCRLADAATTESCSKGQGYSECHASKDLSTLVSLLLGFVGSVIMAQLSGLQQPGFTKDFSRILSLHAVAS
mmetsp:Transcript_37176/g.100622  ORF Transcript_37176/g.100622 Transcript_37176/m.100622 type:complete len:92 (+) Transcript_37176:104-379(+)